MLTAEETSKLSTAFRLSIHSTHPTLRAFGLFHRFFQSTTSHVPSPKNHPSIHPVNSTSPHHSFSLNLPTNKQ
ncbi:hypothetical protein F4806DRAFT_454643 [Annulohypoxylon nitens]|nr:hypothetical protein F4806DRAFT_454643 [Annulohypoxylon nitens]